MIVIDVVANGCCASPTFLFFVLFRNDFYLFLKDVACYNE